MRGHRSGPRTAAQLAPPPANLMSGVSVVATLKAEQAPHQCRCVQNHSPQPKVLERHHIWPEGKGGPTVAANLIYLCPTAHGNVHRYLDHMLKHDGAPPEDRSRYNRATVAIAEHGYRRILAQALVD